jgi:Thymidylate kinase
MGKLIVLEGTDGSGKSTQFGLLKNRLEQDGTAFRTIVFPQYSEQSSALIRMYLSGDFGSHPRDVNAYAASTFYAVDRFAAYQRQWGEDYRRGLPILSDRYTTSNAVHQGAKLPEKEQEEFFRWLYDLEFHRFGLPKPDLVLYLDMPTEMTEKLMRTREAVTHTNADIHEKDLDYLKLCRETGLKAACYYGWHVVSCVRRKSLRTVDDINEELYRLVKKAMED